METTAPPLPTSKEGRRFQEQLQVMGDTGPLTHMLVGILHQPRPPNEAPPVNDTIFDLTHYGTCLPDLHDLVGV